MSKRTRRLTFREMQGRLIDYGLEILVTRGKGSERMISDPKTGKTHPVTYRGGNKRVAIGLLKSIKRRFDLPDKFLQ